MTQSISENQSQIIACVIKHHFEVLVQIALTRACCRHFFRVMKVSHQLWLVLYFRQSPHFPNIPLPSELLVYTGIFELQSREVTCLTYQP